VITLQLLRQAGEALHGQQWQTPLARDLNVADRTLRRWLNGETVPPGISQELLQLVEKRLQHSQQELDRLLEAQRALVSALR
jgi:ribosomal protein S4